MNIRLLVLAGAIAGTLAGSVASAQTIVPNAALRSDRGSDRNLRVEIRRLEGVIDMLQNDRHDYNGHRVRAIEDLQRAREELSAGLRYDNNH